MEHSFYDISDDEEVNYDNKYVLKGGDNIDNEYLTSMVIIYLKLHHIVEFLKKDSRINYEKEEAEDLLEIVKFMLEYDFFFKREIFFKAVEEKFKSKYFYIDILNSVYHKIVYDKKDNSQKIIISKRENSIDRNQIKDSLQNYLQLDNSRSQFIKKLQELNYDSYEPDTLNIEIFLNIFKIIRKIKVLIIVETITKKYKEMKGTIYLFEKFIQRFEDFLKIDNQNKIIENNSGQNENLKKLLIKIFEYVHNFYNLISDEEDTNWEAINNEDIHLSNKIFKIEQEGNLVYDEGDIGGYFPTTYELIPEVKTKLIDMIKKLEVLKIKIGISKPTAAAAAAAAASAKPPPKAKAAPLAAPKAAAADPATAASSAKPPPKAKPAKTAAAPPAAPNSPLKGITLMEIATMQNLKEIYKFKIHPIKFRPKQKWGIFIKSCKINEWLPSTFKFYQNMETKIGTNPIYLDFPSFEINLINNDESKKEGIVVYDGTFKDKLTKHITKRAVVCIKRVTISGLMNSPQIPERNYPSGSDSEGESEYPSPKPTAPITGQPNAVKSVERLREGFFLGKGEGEAQAVDRTAPGSSSPSELLTYLYQSNRFKLKEEKKQNPPSLPIEFFSFKNDYKDNKVETRFQEKGMMKNLGYFIECYLIQILTGEQDYNKNIWGFSNYQKYKNFYDVNCAFLIIKYIEFIENNLKSEEFQKIEKNIIKKISDNCVLGEKLEKDKEYTKNENNKFEELKNRLKQIIIEIETGEQYNKEKFVKDEEYLWNRINPLKSN